MGDLMALTWSEEEKLIRNDAKRIRKGGLKAYVTLIDSKWYLLVDSEEDVEKAAGIINVPEEC